MKELPAIEKTYTLIATDLDRELDEARVQGNQQGIEWLENQRQINDSAYFILVWGQLEARINELCETAIRSRVDSTDWDRRRAWDAYNPDDLRIKFEDKAALVLDRTNTAGTGYRKTMNFYGQRNRVAHGKSLATGIDVPFFISEVYQIISEMRA
ncbi:MAG: hypothetical protein H0T56_05295 [Pseudaminobacter sp.]|nr:hypothetical protein [Pseudaminobacter sp.]